MYLHDNWVGLDDNMVDVASPSRLDGATLGTDGDPQSHLRSTIAKLKARLWVPRCIDAAAERLKIGKIIGNNRNPAQLWIRRQKSVKWLNPVFIAAFHG